ncbi:MAG: ABC transporter permease [Marinifilaceae bacterium]|jgi:putative ABC transport system permease protein|nr:ABC transporter permease [Marinifilaceae bacterium]
MILKYIKLSYREIGNNKTLSLINLLGFAIGLSAFLLLFVYVSNETGYDKFHSKHDRIYKLSTVVKSENRFYRSAINRAETKLAIEEKVPEVEKIAKIYLYGYGNIYVNENRFTNLKLMYADPELFDILDFETICGNLSTALIDDNCAVITEKAAQTLFGDKDPLNQSFKHEDDKIYTVKAVVKKFPKKSHINFDIMASSNYWMKDYRGGLEFSIYMLLQKKCKHDKVLEKCNKINADLTDEIFAQYGGVSSSKAQKITDVYLNSDYSVMLGKQGDINSVYLYSVIALLILIIGIINYVNLFTVHYKSRIKIFSIHKVLGASRKDIIFKLFTNSGIITCLAAILSILLCVLFLPEFNKLIDRNYEFSFLSEYMIWFALVVLFTIIISSIYPTIILFKQKLTNNLKDGVSSNSKFNFTGVLVIFQFVISLVIITSVVVVYLQMKYMMDYPLGYSPQKVVKIGRLNKTIKKNKTAIFNEFDKNPNIESYATSYHSPAGGTSGQGAYLQSEGEKSKISINEKRIQPNYMKTMGIQLYNGKELTKAEQIPEDCVILNKAAAEMFNEKELVGKNLVMFDTNYKIIGITKNHFYYSLKHEISPLMFTYYESDFNHIVVRFKDNPTKLDLESIDKIIKKFDPSWESRSHKLISILNQRYESDKERITLLVYGAALSILLSLLGLFALSLFLLKYKNREIAIRKVNGASISEIILMLNKTYLRWILISFIISIPISIYLANRFLEEFSLKIDISWWIFGFAFILVSLVAHLTVIIQTYKAARQNPVEILKVE